MSALDRAGLYALLEASEDLDLFTKHAEPPDQIAGPALIVAGRDPYQDYNTFGELTTYLTVSILIPRTHGPAMDLIDATLATLRAIYTGIRGCQIGSTTLGLTDRIGGVEYVAAMTQVTLS